MRKMKKFTALALALVMMFSLTAMASAAMITSATKSYTFGSYVAYTTTGYLYYSDNTTSSITVDKMGFSAKNNGQTDLRYGFFRGYDGKGLGVGHSILNPYEGDQFRPEMEYAIAPGQLSQYFTPPWGAIIGATNYVATYEKYGSSAVFEMNASPSGEVLPSTNRIVSYPNSFSTPMTRTTDPLESQQRIIFSALDDSFTVADSYSLDTVRSSDSPMFVEAKAPRILNKVDGTEYEMDIQSLAGGEAMYTVNTQELDESLVDISAPVFYVEHDVEEVNVPLFAGMERESSMLAVTVGETQGISYLEDGHLVLDFTATDDSLVPFDMVLISNGEVRVRTLRGI